MPVNIWPILLPLLLIYLWCLWILYRKIPKLAYALLGLTILCGTIFYFNTDVRIAHTRNMSWKTYELPGGSTVELRDPSDSYFQTWLASSKLAEYLKARQKETVRVELIETYDFGHLRAYRIETIDGLKMETWTGNAVGK